MYALKTTSLFALALGATALSAKESKPNVIFIISDDVGIGDISCYGAEKVQTPNIDKLADAGVQFMNGYAAGSVSTPTRYSIITGEYPHRSWCKSGAVTIYDPLLPDHNQTTIADMFKKEGYRTAAIGKWHLGYGDQRPADFDKPFAPGPLELGFDYHLGIPNNHNDVIRAFVRNHYLVGKMPGVKLEIASNDKDIVGISEERVDDMVDTKLTNEALHFIRESQDSPFFLYYTPCAAHTHITPNVKFRGTSEAGQYGDYLAELDYHVGEIVTLLDELELRENTIIVFASDNGGQLVDFTANAGKGLNIADESGDVILKSTNAKRTAIKLGHKINLDYRSGKASSYDGGFRIPFIVNWPGHYMEGVKSEAMVNSVDLFATFADVLGYKVKKDVAIDSRSILDALVDGAPVDNKGFVRNNMVQQSGNGVLGYVDGDWKLVQYSKGNPKQKSRDELYNIASDPYEKQNVAKDNQEIVDRLSSDLKAVFEE